MTYDYVCMACAHTWEAEQRITEQPLKSCPQCHEQTAKRQVSGGQGFILKGGGWYSDLYSSAKPAVAAPSSDSKTEKKSEAKSESAGSPCASGACGTSACPATAAN